MVHAETLYGLFRQQPVLLTRGQALRYNRTAQISAVCDPMQNIKTEFCSELKIAKTLFGHYSEGTFATNSKCQTSTACAYFAKDVWITAISLLKPVFRQFIPLKQSLSKGAHCLKGCIPNSYTICKCNDACLYVYTHMYISGAQLSRTALNKSSDTFPAQRLDYIKMQKLGGSYHF